MDGLTLELRQFFPNIDSTNFKQTSSSTPNYNCVAWAAGDNSKWWWPDSKYNYYWPENVTREETLEACIEAYRTIGYEVCANGDLEERFEKVVIYINSSNGALKHAARQLINGKWTSKLGENIDISHDEPETLVNGVYGIIATYMKREITGQN